jgi:ActR/RegA family two-component response regulator
MAEATGNLLFVDDEPSIRLTLPPVLQKAGFEVRVAESVSEALYEINSRQFDAVISDLNIGEEGDGFLVTSAMRHVQPECLTFILTGYPAFETALQAIHNRIDDYLVKPVDIEVLTQILKEKLLLRVPRVSSIGKRLSSLLKKEAAHITGSALGNDRSGNGSGSHRELNRLFTDLIERFESDEKATGARIVSLAREYGRKQLAAKHPPSTLAKQFGAIEQETYDVVQKNLAGVDIAWLISDLQKFSMGLHSALEASLAVYGKEQKGRASGKSAGQKKRRKTS